MSKQLLKTGEAAEVLEVTPRTINRWVLSGKLKPFGRIGEQLRFSPEEVRKMIKPAKVCKRP
jgi:excisionase family DNA binding protein